MTANVIRLRAQSRMGCIAKRNGGRGGGGVDKNKLQCNELSEESVIIHSDVFSAIKMSSAVNLSFKSPAPLCNFSF